ncbi:hypothetical protein ABZS66_31635 [Dactylosporangium sp. NPDC005572]
MSVVVGVGDRPEDQGDGSADLDNDSLIVTPRRRESDTPARSYPVARTD